MAKKAEYNPLLDLPAGMESHTMFIAPMEAINLVRRLRNVKFGIEAKLELVVTPPDEEGNYSAYTLSPLAMVSASTLIELLERAVRLNARKVEKGCEPGTIRVTRYHSLLVVGC